MTECETYGPERALKRWEEDLALWEEAEKQWFYDPNRLAKAAVLDALQEVACREIEALERDLEAILARKEALDNLLTILEKEARGF